MKFNYLLVAFLLLLIFIAAEIPAQSFQTGGIEIVMSDYGRVRVIDPAGIWQIDRSSFLAGVNSNYVFSYWLSAESEDAMKNIGNPQLSDFEIYGSINNTYDDTGESPDFLVKHNVYGWQDGAYALVKFTVINRETGSLNTYLGMEIISIVDDSYGLETVEYLTASQIISIYRLPTSTYTGYKLLSANLNGLKTIDWYDGYNESNPDLFSWISYDEIDTVFDSGGDGATSFFSQVPVDIAAGDSAIMWVAISIGADETEMVANMDLAEGKYGLITDVGDNVPSMPSAYKLNQNYPNPFNPSTIISFELPERSNVVLKVFNLIGEEVALVASGQYEAGTHYFDFDASNLPTGIYIYSLQTNSSTISKKMTLLK